MTEAWRELAEIQDRLLELGDEPSEERAVLLERRAVLRAEARSGPTISLDGRSDEDLETEAESLRVRIKARGPASAGLRWGGCGDPRLWHASGPRRLCRRLASSPWWEDGVLGSPVGQLKLALQPLTKLQRREARLRRMLIDLHEKGQPPQSPPPVHGPLVLVRTVRQASNAGPASMRCPGDYLTADRVRATGGLRPYRSGHETCRFPSGARDGTFHPAHPDEIVAGGNRLATARGCRKK